MSGAVEMRTRIASLPLPGGRVLHVALTFDVDGAPADLCIGCAFADSPVMRALGEGVNVPASALPGLRDALAALERDMSATEARGRCPGA